MTTLQVGSGQQYSTIAAAVNAANSGDTVDVQAGTYTNDFVSISKNLTLNAVGGLVTMNATAQPSNGKAILTEGAPGLTVNINGFAFTGATVPDGNGAGIRYEGGTLNVENSYFGNNQNGILGASDPNGVITINNSEFDHNGAGDGRTHNMYIGYIAQFTLTNSYTHDAVVGHEIKSRAANNIITNNRILDNSGSASYEIDLPNGGNASITGNTIQQSAQSQNPNIIAYGEEGVTHPGTTLSFTGNTIINDRSSGTALWNASGNTAIFANNSVYSAGSTTMVSGPATQTGTTTLTTRPTLDTAAVNLNPAPTPVSTVPTPTPVPTAGLVLNVSEDAYLGDAQYTISVDGQQVGGTRTATSLHTAGQSGQVALGSLTGSHQIAVTFLNDAYAGTPQTDRNLYVNSATYNGQTVAGGSLTLMSAGTQGFSVTGDVAAPIPTPTPVPTPAPVPTTGLVVSVAEDAYLGDAQFTVSVDGKQVGGPYTATASEAAGQSQPILVASVLSSGSHIVGISFINDAYAGTPSTDRNLYVTGASYNGNAVGGSSATLMSNGTDTFAMTTNPAPTSTATLNVSEDAYLGDAQFTVSVDGTQIGGTYTATASHSAGQSQAITLSGIAENFSAHDIAVTFLNDKWDGTSSTDRNLYVNSIQLAGQSVAGGAAALMSAGTQHFAAMAPSNWTG